MKFVIVGYGRVGIRTARILREEGHEVIVVDNDPEKIRRAQSDGFETIEGDGSEDSTLEGANLETVDAVGGLTGDLNANFAACMIGKHHGCRTVLRIDEDYRQDIYRKYADDVDEVVYPERLGAAGAKTALLGGNFNVVSDLTEKLQLSVFRIGEGASAVGKQVHNVGLPESARIYAHGRADESLTIPLPGTTLDVGDQVAVIVETESLDGVKEALSG
ncbi:potassium channel family protein [Natranaeroarchaeum aerophilus]|uniref:TrkA family potassium uptake protein n=1 Tax=Natranaeroarchaeum aerophilus TaxID=2917711 RepID=A0AAE3FNU3_9EURY|nr:TrkA family potassium uptake protein [Natranaeroarchaeum aerophilus]MCL9812405.1 TrkA family potassium uptake protein [Natranaeroarchaeum aerophilus]